MNTKVYKWCAVPTCRNTSIKTPQKLFVYVPNKKDIRDKWLKLAQRDPSKIKTNSPIYFCEDHFDLANDMENFMQYHLMGSVSQVRMKRGCMPSKFECQPVNDGKKQTNNMSRRRYVSKKRKMMVLEECEKQTGESIVTDHLDSVEVASSSSDGFYIKQEPGVSSTTDQNYPIGSGPEFVNIKEEFDTVSIKIEPIDSSPSNDTAINLSRDQLISANVSTTNEEKCAKVTVKQEVLDYSEDGKSDTEYALDHEEDCTIAKSDATSNSNDFSCQVCGIVFSSKINMLRHYVTHKRQIHRCDLCPKSFFEAKQLVSHRRIHMQGFKCTFCDKTFKHEYLLKSHLRKHNTDKPFTCDHCQMKLKHKYTLIRHMQLHNGVKPYTCKYCNKTFMHPWLMKPHLRVHSGEKPYQCPTCSKYFSHKQNMQRHAQRHERVKNLTCEVCNKIFPKESSLKYHMKIHISEKYFCCHVCPEKFSHRRNILRHYKRKHPNETYECKETDASVALKVWNEVVKEKTRKPDKFLRKSDGSITNENNVDGENESEYIVPDPLSTFKKSIFIKIEKDDNYDENETYIKK